MYEDFSPDDWSELMEEVPGGPSHGRKATVLGSGWEDDAATSKWGPLNTEESGRTAFERDDDGHRLVYPGHGGTKGHPGGTVLHPDEFVDQDVLRELAFEEFGFTPDELESVYTKRTATFDDEVLALRARIDARMLDVARSGGQLRALALALGISESTVTRAVRRAREAEAMGPRT